MGDEREIERINMILVYILVGLACGFVDSTLGMGFEVTSSNILITFGVTIGFESFMWSLTMPMIIGGLILTPISGYLVARVPKKWLGILIGLWLIALNVYGLLS